MDMKNGLATRWQTILFGVAFLVASFILGCLSYRAYTKPTFRWLLRDGSIAYLTGHEMIKSLEDLEGFKDNPEIVDFYATAKADADRATRNASIFGIAGLITAIVGVLMILRTRKHNLALLGTYIYF